MHRLILTSATYQLASRFGDEHDLRTDPDNLYLWRSQRRRLEGEAVWDALHAVAGNLNLQVGGSPVAPPLAPEELAALRYRYMWIVPADLRQHVRRGLYILTLRNFKFPLFEVFDAPQNAVSAPGRDVSTVAPQALWLLNNPTAWRQAQHLAARLVREAGKAPQAQVVRLWKIALGRPPTVREQKEALDLLEKLSAAEAGPAARELPPEPTALPPERRPALVQLCLGIFNHNEFLYID